MTISLKWERLNREQEEVQALVCEATLSTKEVTFRNLKLLKEDRVKTIPDEQKDIWQKDLGKIKELEAKILSLECDNNELQEEANYYRNESLVEKAEKKKLAKKAFNAGVKYGNYHSLDEELSELLSNETFNFEDWYNKEVQ